MPKWVLFDFWKVGRGIATMNTKSPWQTADSPVNDAQGRLGKWPMLKITLEHAHGLSLEMQQIIKSQKPWWNQDSWKAVYLTSFFCLKQHFTDFNKFLSSNSFSLAKYPSLQFQLTGAENFPCIKVFLLGFSPRTPACSCQHAAALLSSLHHQNSLLPAKGGTLKQCFWAAVLAALFSCRQQCGSLIKLYHWTSSGWIKALLLFCH